MASRRRPLTTHAAAHRVSNDGVPSPSPRTPPPRRFILSARCRRDYISFIQSPRTRAHLARALLSSMWINSHANVRVSSGGTRILSLLLRAAGSHKGEVRLTEKNTEKRQRPRVGVVYPYCSIALKKTIYT